jgi:hypothetical protein
LQSQLGDSFLLSWLQLLDFWHLLFLPPSLFLFDKY